MELLKSLWGDNLGEHIITLVILFLMAYVIIKSLPKKGGKGDSQQ